MSGQLKKVKCNGCGSTNIFDIRQSGIWYWCRCRKCGFHTSSYLRKSKAIQACKDGEHYISENGNKCICE